MAGCRMIPRDLPWYHGHGVLKSTPPALPCMSATHHPRKRGITRREASMRSSLVHCRELSDRRHATAQVGTARTLRFDPSIGQHGAFYFADVGEELADAVVVAGSGEAVCPHPGPGLAVMHDVLQPFSCPHCLPAATWCWPIAWCFMTIGTSGCRAAPLFLSLLRSKLANHPPTVNMSLLSKHNL